MRNWPSALKFVLLNNFRDNVLWLQSSICISHRLIPRLIHYPFPILGWNDAGIIGQYTCVPMGHICQHNDHDVLSDQVDTAKMNWLLILYRQWSFWFYHIKKSFPDNFPYLYWCILLSKTNRKTSQFCHKLQYLEFINIAIDPIVGLH